MAAKRRSAIVPTVIESFVKALVVSHKAVALYPPSSNMPRDTARSAVTALGKVLERYDELRLTITKDGIFFAGVPVSPDNAAYLAFARELYGRQLSEVRFHSGATESDIVAFLNVLKYTPTEVAAAGGYESRLWDMGVAAITVAEIQVSLSEAADDEELAQVSQMDRRDIDGVLAAAYGGRSGERRLLALFMADSEAVASYLGETYGTAEKGTGSAALAERFAELAEVADALPDGQRDDALRSLGAALEQLDPEMRRSLLMDSVLPEARTNEPLAEIIRHLDVDSVCKMLVEGIDEGEASKAGLTRAIRNLAMISMAHREEVVTAAGAAMIGAGLSQEMVTDVVATAAPRRLDVSGGPSTQSESEQPADAIFRLMDLASTATTVEQPDADVEPLIAEAGRGITDGDVIMALVTLVGLDGRDAQFATTMTMLEDSLDLLIERGEIDIAADSADALMAAAQDESLTEEQRNRLRKAVSRFSRPSDIRAVAHALRLYKPGSVEHESARRLLDALGSTALNPLMEQLADEPDMAVRKSIVDLLSQMAPAYVSELGSYVADSRWYVVRNVVDILGSTKSSAVLQYLGRTIRHPESRVRRETIRALASIHDRLAHEMLIATLEDDDAQNVRLSARYLGASGVKGAVKPLEQVARGEGRGNRESGPRIEAIEALGRLGAVEATATLESIAGRRSLMSGSRGRELRAAAESALARIRSLKESQ